MEPVLGRIGAEGRETEHGDAAPRGVEGRFGIPQRTGAVRDVSLEMRIRSGLGAEALDLPLRVGRIGVRRGEVAHEADHLERRREKLGDAPATHSRVELHVDAHARRDVVGRDDELEMRVARLPHLAVQRRPHDDDARRGELAPQRKRFGDGGDAERRGARAERRARDVGRAVCVRVRLDDGPELRALQRVEQPAHVVPDGSQVDRDLGAMHYRSTRGSASIRSLATRPARCGASTDARC